MTRPIAPSGTPFGPSNSGRMSPPADEPSRHHRADGHDPAGRPAHHRSRRQRPLAPQVPAQCRADRRRPRCRRGPGGLRAGGRPGLDVRARAGAAGSAAPSAGSTRRCRDGQRRREHVDGAGALAVRHGRPLRRRHPARLDRARHRRPRTRSSGTSATSRRRFKDIYGDRPSSPSSPTCWPSPRTTRSSARSRRSPRSRSSS